MAEPILRIRNLQKNFGGLRVTDNLSVDIEAAEVHALIGPNGAGKTTLINQISGIVSPDAGRIEFAGSDITFLPVHLRARAGLVRSFQIISVLQSVTVLENVSLAVQSRQGSSFRFLADASKEPKISALAFAALEEVGLRDRCGTIAGRLSHGERRSLELAIALAMRPRLLLLDEPMAGTGREETARLVATLKRLKGRFPILLVEHDMNAVFALADRVSVLIYGRILTTGEPGVVRNDPKVISAYLGDEVE